MAMRPGPSVDILPVSSLASLILLDPGADLASIGGFCEAVPLQQRCHMSPHLTTQ